MKIALTGGPSAGKTALVTLVEKQFPHQIKAVPEAATILFQGGFPRGNDFRSLEHQQRAIYSLQVELEDMFHDSYPEKVLLCDRGTVDGAAYWPGSQDAFFEAVGTTLIKEINRYDYVIHLESPNGHYYDHSNSARIEKPSEAHILDGKIKSAWSTHPNRLVIHCHKNFAEKINEVLEHISKIMREAL